MLIVISSLGGIGLGFRSPTYFIWEVVIVKFNWSKKYINIKKEVISGYLQPRSKLINDI